MRNGRLLASTFGTLLVISLGNVAGTPAAQAVVCANSTTPEAQAADLTADVTPMTVKCCQSDAVTITSSSKINIPFNSTVYRDGPGGTMTLSKSFSGTTSYSVTAGSAAEAGVVFAKATVEVSGTIARENTTSGVHEFSHNITSTKYGNAQYVSYGYKVNWSGYHVNSDCSHTSLGTGTINFPSTAEGGHYWETSS